MSEKRLKVLEMLSAGKITIDQANPLIQALNGEEGVCEQVHAERSDNL